MCRKKVAVLTYHLKIATTIALWYTVCNSYSSKYAYKVTSLLLSYGICQFTMPERVL